MAEPTIPISIDSISANYVGVAPTLANCLVFLLATFPVPDWLFERWLGKARPLLDNQQHYPNLLAICRIPFLIRRAFDHMKFMDFTVTSGNKIVYLIWKIGLIKFWRKHVIPSVPEKHLKIEKAGPSSVFS